MMSSLFAYLCNLCTKAITEGNSKKSIQHESMQYKLNWEIVKKYKATSLEI